MVCWPAETWASSVQPLGRLSTKAVFMTSCTVPEVAPGLLVSMQAGQSLCWN